LGETESQGLAVSRSRHRQAEPLPMMCTLLYRLKRLKCLLSKK
jgi:hypothetical protein